MYHDIMVHTALHRQIIHSTEVAIELSIMHPDIIFCMMHPDMVAQNVLYQHTMDISAVAGDFVH